MERAEPELIVVMPCSTHLTRIPEFLDGTLATERAAELAAHLVACEGCRAVMLTQRVPQHGLPVSGPDDPEFWGPMDAALLAELDHPGSATLRSAPVPLMLRPTRWLTRQVPTRRLTLLAYSAALCAAILWGWSRAPLSASSSAPTASQAAPESPSLAPRDRERTRAAPASHVPVHGSL